jgi:hypothetical protein
MITNLYKIIKDRKNYFVIFLILFSLALLGVQKSGFVFSAENIFQEEGESTEKPINCRQQSQINVEIPKININLDLGPNELEIPTGEATDETEAAAEETMKQLQVIIDASAVEIDSATQMVNLVLDPVLGCREDRCEKHCTNQGGGCFCAASCAVSCDDPLSTCRVSCPPEGETSNPLHDKCCYNVGLGCKSDPCSGEVCGPGTEAQIDRLQGVIETQVKNISGAYQKINDIIFLRKNSQIGTWWCDPFCSLPTHICPFGECLSDIELIEFKLEKARSGNYRIGTKTGAEWIEQYTGKQLPGLKDCVVRPEDEESSIIGEKTSWWLFKCSEAVDLGFLNPENCYGFSEDNPSKADNYLCCY